jgi:Prp8 binding protein
MLQGHKHAVLQVVWSRDGSNLYSCSVDETAGYWDLKTGERIKNFRGHRGIVNSIAVSQRGNEMIVTASDDKSLKVWDARQKDVVMSFENGVANTSCEFGRDGVLVYGGDCAGEIRVFANE